MQYFVGTSGYSYKEWKGSFYPEKFSDKKMLGYYAERFSAVEINYTFRQIPSATTIKSWAAQVPETFQFVCKAPQAITHHKKLQGAEEQTTQFFEALRGLKKRQGPVLFQLPPNFKKDLSCLEQFLKTIKGMRVACEFRHQSWFEEDVFDCLRAHKCSLCVSDGEGFPETDLINTANWGYVRLRREEYTEDDLKKWLKKFQAHDWNEMYVFFKHEDAGTGPKLAARFHKLLKIKTKPFGAEAEGGSLFND
jgi:uncharacterized protein YecE (DUF72 family)